MELKLYYDGAIGALLEDAVCLVQDFMTQCEYVVVGTNKFGTKKRKMATLDGATL